MDLFLALVFLFTGVFPISIQRHFAKHAELQIVDNKDLGIFEDYTAYLKYNQQYVFCMGWILWYVLFFRGLGEGWY